ncbi:inositol monophosphatase [Alteribacter lacisalsi]|uniref:Inositol monophosphatase n=1 Tax=Alteribacter lacisalsi TaxID=2045244 RepID=A0A2W0HZ04_9BACI|nr:inositol monophosphatase [Alteribacter lacisalsi]PYZ99048.1 inositol monophosphatase [Alteribacter lacisalsi]
MMDQSAIHRFAVALAKEAGLMLMDSLTQNIAAEYKTSAADLVTEMDRKIECFFAEKVNTEFPEHMILGEEGTVTDQRSYIPEEETVWLIDPIDGTTNFVHQKRNFAISVGVYHKGSPIAGVIFDPAEGECFHALSGEGAWLNETKLERLSPTSEEEALIAMNSLWLVPNEYADFEKMQSLVSKVRGVRCQGSAALELAHVACGRLDGSIAFGLGPWDFGAGLVLLKEVGAVVTTSGNDSIYPFDHSSVIAAKPGLHEILAASYLR